MKRYSSYYLVLVLMVTSAWGSTLRLRNGTQITGTLVSESPTSIVIRDQSGVERTFDKDEIRVIDFSDGVTAPANSRNYNAPPPLHARPSMVVPTGTEISVRTNDDIDSTTAHEGQRFSAVLADDVVGDAGNVLIRKGSDAELVLREVSSGSTTSSPDLTLDLQSVTTGGHTYRVSTTDLERGNNSGLGKNKRTATMVGGGAVLGTLLGAIAGGGKGAAIGAVSGAAVGGTAQVLTKGKEVKVPSETVLNFKLDEPLHLEAER